MTELEKKLARRRNLNGENEKSISEITIPSDSSTKNKNFISSETRTNASNIATAAHSISPDRKNVTRSISISSESSGNSSMSELQLKLSRRRTLNKEHEPVVSVVPNGTAASVDRPEMEMLCNDNDNPCLSLKRDEVLCSQAANNADAAYDNNRRDLMTHGSDNDVVDDCGRVEDIKAGVINCDAEITTCDGDGSSNFRQMGEGLSAQEDDIYHVQCCDKLSSNETVMVGVDTVDTLGHDTRRSPPVIIHPALGESSATIIDPSVGISDDKIVDEDASLTHIERIQKMPIESSIDGAKLNSNLTHNEHRNNHDFTKSGPGNKGNRKGITDSNILFKDDDNSNNSAGAQLDSVYQLLIDNEAFKQEIVKLKETSAENERLKKDVLKVHQLLALEQSNYSELLIVNESLKGELSQSVLDQQNLKSEILDLRYLSFENDELKIQVKELSVEVDQLRSEISKTSELSIDNKFLKREISSLKLELQQQQSLPREVRAIVRQTSGDSLEPQQQVEPSGPSSKSDLSCTNRRYVNSLRYGYGTNVHLVDSSNDDQEENKGSLFGAERNETDGGTSRSSTLRQLVYDEYDILNYRDSHVDDTETNHAGGSNSNELSLDLLLQSVSGMYGDDAKDTISVSGTMASKWSHKARTLINEKELVKSFLSISLIESRHRSKSISDGCSNDNSVQQDDGDGILHAQNKTLIRNNNMEYTEFLNKFAKCEELVNFTRDFISSVLGPEGDTSRPKNPKKLSYTFYGLHKLNIRCKSFFDQMQDIFVNYSAFKDESEERIICARDCLEQYVLGRIGDYAFQTVQNDEEDEKLLTRMRELSFITLESLDIKPSLNNEDMIHQSMEELKRINDYRTPGDKVNCIVKCATMIFKLLGMHAQQKKHKKLLQKQKQMKQEVIVTNEGNSSVSNPHNDGGTSNETPLISSTNVDYGGDNHHNDNDGDGKEDMEAGAGADDFLPIFIWVVLKSHIPKLISNCEYIQTYLNPSRLMSQSGYCLINLRSAIEFITYLTAESINMDPMVFDMKCSEMMSSI